MPQQLANTTVLIIDNEPDIVKMISDMLTFNGASTCAAISGAEGLAMLHEIMPSVVLLDLTMPCMNGWEVLDAIRNDAALCHLTVIAVTAHVIVGARDQVLAAGFDGYVPKPFQITTLLREIQNCLQKQAAA